MWPVEEQKWDFSEIFGTFGMKKNFFQIFSLDFFPGKKKKKVWLLLEHKQLNIYNDFVKGNICANEHHFKMCD